MFYYEGQACPVCGKAFEETDDIVSCPECGAPHHRACWLAAGHCHFADRHGTPEQWTRPEADTATEEPPVTEPETTEPVTEEVTTPPTDVTDTPTESVPETQEDIRKEEAEDEEEDEEENEDEPSYGIWIGLTIVAAVVVAALLGMMLVKPKGKYSGRR